MQELEKAKELWDEFGNIPVNENDEIEIEWHGFGKGTDREEIWHWFEETFNVSVAVDLMGIQNEQIELKKGNKYTLTVDYNNEYIDLPVVYLGKSNGKHRFKSIVSGHSSLSSGAMKYHECTDEEINKCVKI